MAPYTLYVSDVSYYSGKLEAFLRYRGIEHRRVCINTPIMRQVILPATGVMKVPCMRTDDGRWLKDSTPMMAWLDAQHPGPTIYPEAPATHFLSLLLEDYADEWLWRPAMHYRWSFADSHRLLRRRLGDELGHGLRYPKWLVGWYMRWRQYLVFVRGDGVRRNNRTHVEAIYHDTLRQLSALLTQHPFLQGERPGIVDFAFFASMFRHFALDPASAKIMVARAPAVYAWVARVWNASSARLLTAPMGDFGAAAWDAVFEQLSRQYLPYLDANAQAYADGRKRFSHATDGVSYPKLPVVRYRVACRERLLSGYRALSAAQRRTVQARLPDSAAQWLESAANIPSGLEREFDLPLAQHYPAARGWYGLKLLSGTPWDLPAAPLPPADARPQHKQQ